MHSLTCRWEFVPAPGHSTYRHPRIRCQAFRTAAWQRRKPPTRAQPQLWNPGSLSAAGRSWFCWRAACLGGAAPFHPSGEGDEIYLDLQDKVTRWLVVHLGMMIFIPLMAAVVFLLVREVEGTAAWVSRIAVLFFAVFYGAFETLQGIANGVVVDQVNGLPESKRDRGAELVQAFTEGPLVRDLGCSAASAASG